MGVTNVIQESGKMGRYSEMTLTIGLKGIKFPSPFIRIARAKMSGYARCKVCGQRIEKTEKCCYYWIEKTKWGCRKDYTHTKCLKGYFINIVRGIRTNEPKSKES